MSTRFQKRIIITEDGKWHEMTTEVYVYTESHNEEHRGTGVVIVRDDGKVTIGTSLTHDKDTFDRKKGKQYAYDRAIDAMIAGQYHADFGKFVLGSITYLPDNTTFPMWFRIGLKSDVERQREAMFLAMAQVMAHKDEVTQRLEDIALAKEFYQDVKHNRRLNGVIQRISY